MSKVRFKIGTKSQYEALVTKNEDAIYFLTDTKELYKGSVLFGVGKAATTSLAGLLSPEDKAKLDSAIGGCAFDLTPTDQSLVINTVGAGKTIKVKLSNSAGNALKIAEDGLFVKDLEGTIDELAAILTWAEL